MITIDGLRAFGAGVDEGLARCMNNEAFYVRLVEKVLKDKGFDEPDAAVAAHDTDAAFEAWISLGAAAVDRGCGKTGQVFGLI